MTDFVVVTSNALSIDEAVKHVEHESAGAISTFIGTTRDSFQGKVVEYLEYEGYIPMAEKELKAICTSIRTRWPNVVGIAMMHRLGVVAVKEASVIIAVSSPHRRDAIEAVAYGIDTLKARVPIWKLEKYQGDARMWKENAEWRSMSPMAE